MQVISFVPTFAGWQQAARKALGQGREPEALLWEEWGGAQPGLDLGAEDEEESAGDKMVWKVPRPFLVAAKRVACHRSPERWALLYRVLWRLTHGEPRLWEVVVDPDVHRLAEMDKAVRRDVHKMRAFVRFREVDHEGARWYAAWFEPEYHIVELNAPFFVDRFAQMRWSILTPDRCIHWDGKALTVTESVSRAEAPAGDEMEKLWLTYYSHIFNPARVKTEAMVREMPKKYWKNLPEAEMIPGLLEQAPTRVQEMLARSKSQAAMVPQTTDLEILREAAAGCEGCPLYRQATQTVFGEGPVDAALVFVGEQPGDAEDLAGHPFIGPAGRLFDQALAEAGIDRTTAYVTNAVKHFKYEARGKQRIHKKPLSKEVAACRPWLSAELGSIKPRMVVCLGGTAASSVFRSALKVHENRGKWMASEFCERTLITVHPSSLLRAPDEATRQREYALFVQDLKLVSEGL